MFRKGSVLKYYIKDSGGYFMSNAYSGLLKEFVDNIVNLDVFGVRTGILNGKKYCIVAGNAVWCGNRLVGVVDPEEGFVEDLFCTSDFYLVDDGLLDQYESSLEMSEDIVPLIAKYEGKYEFSVIGNQLDFVKDYVLGQDREGTFAYFVKNIAGIENLIVLDKSVLLKDWDVVKGIDEDELSKFGEIDKLPIGCCNSIFDVLSSDVDSDYYKSLPCLQVESVLDSRFLGKEGRRKDISGVFTDARLNIIRNAISSVKLLTDTRVSSGTSDGTEVREGSFCLFNGINKLWIATVSTTDVKYEENRVSPVDSLIRRIDGCNVEKWNYGDCVDSIYEFANLVNNIVEKNSKLDVQAVFVFPCGIHDKPRAYVARNSDGSCTVSMIVPYYN